MKRIGLYLAFPPDGGGSFQYADSILAAAAALPTEDFEIVVVHAHIEWDKRVADSGRQISIVKVEPSISDWVARLLLRVGLPLAIWHGLAPYIGGIERKLLQQRCDLWLFPAQDRLSYTLPSATVGTIHDLMHIHEPSFPEVSASLMHRRRERLYRNMCARSRAILVDSETGKSHVLAAYSTDPSRIYVLPYTAPSYIRASSAPLDFDVRYPLPAQYVFYPAQLWQHKNHVRLIEALAIVRRHHPELHLVLAGSGKNADDQIRAAILRLGLDDAVHHLGYVEDAYMGELYRRSLGLVMPTFFGPTNIPPLEAMATGTPMALSRVYAMQAQSGDAAIYFDPKSTEEMASAVIELVGSAEARKRMIDAGRERFRALDQNAFNAQFERIMKTIVSKM
jgi:glycosyltransferase involved in cell wall biosynthesis